MTAIHQIKVSLDNRSYEIVVGANLYQRATEFVKPLLNRPRIVIVTDENVGELHLAGLRDHFAAAQIDAQSIVLPPGEATKSFAQLEKLCDELLRLQIERNDIVVAFGGGVIGDLTGFAAAILRRGCRFVQIPTTLLAQVDSSVGGKTAINAKRGKNLIGAFHQPSLVLADIDVLETLPAREIRAGYAEVIKYGLLGDAEFFGWLETHGKKLVSGDTDARIEAVRRSITAKARIVEQDEHESGIRALLNLGHTFGHALEAHAGFSNKLLHGESVALGMMLAFEYSVLEGFCKQHDLDRVRKHMTSVGLPVEISDIPAFSASADQLMQHVFQDKKVSDGKLTFILTRGIGEAFISKDVPPARVQAFLESKL